MKAATITARTKGIAFVFLAALTMVTASERVYWYLGGATFESIFAIAGFYMIPTLAALWALGSGPSSRLHQVILAGAIFGFVVEGVLTTVVYEDGPLPVMAALFVGWHGLLSVVSFFYLTRKWLLEGRWRPLVLGSTLMGLLWGVWSIVYTLPESLEDFEETFAVMAPGDFAVYALVIGVAFAVAHWLIGYVWPDRFAPGVWGRRGIVLLLFAYAALAVLPVIWWAPLKFAVLVGGSLWLLRRSRQAHPDEPSAIAALQGRVPLYRVAPLMLMPAVAALSYWWVWSAGLDESAVQEVFSGISVLTVVAGLVGFGWAWRRSVQRREPSSGKQPAGDFDVTV